MAGRLAPFTQAQLPLSAPEVEDKSDCMQEELMATAEVSVKTAIKSASSTIIHSTEGGGGHDQPGKKNIWKERFKHWVKSEVQVR